MYSTVKEVHIALDQRLQQSGANSHIRIAPQYYDMVLNDALDLIINSKFDARYNTKQTGFEQTVGKYDELQMFKKQVLISKYDMTDGNYLFRLPFDYKNMVACNSDISINPTISKSAIEDSKQVITVRPESILSNSTLEVTVTIDANDYTFIPSITANDIVNNKDLTFILYNQILAFFKQLSNTIGVVLYRENDTLYLYDTDITITSSNDWISVFKPSNEVTAYSYTSDVKVLKAPIRILPSADIEMINNNYYHMKASLRSPIATISNNELIVKNDYSMLDSTIGMEMIRLEYLRSPIPFSIDMDTMEHNIPFIDDVISTAIDKLLLLVKDPTFTTSYQITNNNI